MKHSEVQTLLQEVFGSDSDEVDGDLAISPVPITGFFHCRQYVDLATQVQDSTQRSEHDIRMVMSRALQLAPLTSHAPGPWVAWSRTDVYSSHVQCFASRTRFWRRLPKKAGLRSQE